MADKQAAPLLEKLKSNPRDGALLVQVGRFITPHIDSKKQPIITVAHSIRIQRMLRFAPSLPPVSIAMAILKVRLRS